MIYIFARISKGFIFCAGISYSILDICAKYLSCVHFLDRGGSGNCFEDEDLEDGDVVRGT